MADQIKPSDEIHEHATGGRRGSRAGKGRYDLIPPEAERELALHFEQGAAVYGDRNWQKGLPLGRYVDSLKRHLNQWCRGERDEPHLRAVLWNAMALLWTVGQVLDGKLSISLDDAGYLAGDLEAEGPDFPEDEDGNPDDIQGGPDNVPAIPVADPGSDIKEAARELLKKLGPMKVSVLFEILAADGYGVRDIHRNYVHDPDVRVIEHDGEFYAYLRRGRL